ncbi:hypothetical protein ICM05_08795 [Leucobacter sp. cx-42]|uniref:hypothetical protein n=1 Tax=unclassified Leucobacter TaxID=2621730 RepID=UPI00165E98A6|nr:MULTISPECIES: hypothetical protein [unclassified Leucobacter]MBC9954740.1 hypothetical protein [Leucobacter sp. cx-42]
MEDKQGWLKEELAKAYRSARLGKTKKPEVMEFDKIAAAEMSALASEIHGRRYTPRPSTAGVKERVRSTAFAGLTTISAQRGGTAAGRPMFSSLICRAIS